MFLLAGSLSLIACGADTHDDATADSEETTQVLRRGNGGDPGTLDPALAEDVHAFNVLIDLYEGLVAEAADGSLVQGVAESWDISDGGLTYRFKLRPEARWSNGDPVVAENFVNAMRRAASPEITSAYGFLLEPIQNFSDIKSGEKPMEQLGVSAIDETTLEIRLAAPVSYFLSVLAMPITYPLHRETPTPAQFSNSDGFVSNGAYVLADRQIEGLIRLTRNDKYWDNDSTAIETIEYLPVVDNISELNRYRAGELDITATIPPSHYRTVETTLPGELRVAPALAFYYLAFDLSEPPFDNIALRQALSMAIDRQQLVSLIGRGEQPAYGVVPPGVANHVRAEYEWHDLSPADREQQAKALYRAAGYDADNPLTLRLTYDVGDIHERVALTVSSMWHDVLGAEVELDKREWKYFLDTREDRSEWQVMRFAWVGDYNDASTFTDIFRSQSPQNLPRYENSDYDHALDLAAMDLRQENRMALMTDAEQMLLDDYPIAPLYFFVSKHLVKSRVMGFEDNVLDRHPSKYLSISSNGAIEPTN